MVSEDASIAAAAHLPLTALAGVDEVGRGCLFGPVVAATCQLSASAIPTLAAAGVTDSKRLSAQDRARLLPLILQEATAYGLGQASAREVDRHGIRTATERAMIRAIQRLKQPPTLLLVDGNLRLRPWEGPQQVLVGGDHRCMAIACASIIAKQTRDALLVRLDSRFPGFGLSAHKGYGTARHRDALQRLGATSLHRMSFLRKLVVAGSPP